VNLEELKKRLFRLVNDFPAVSLAYLFGSRVAGPTGPGSDYDVGLLLDRPHPSAPALARIGHELAVLLETDRVDVVFLHQAPLELAYAIISQGRVLYQRDVATRVEYEARVLSRYCDYLPYLRAQRAEILSGEERASRIQRYREALGRTERTLREIRAAQRQDQSGV
jgi:predicted nucleotidyltransferase